MKEKVLMWIAFIIIFLGLSILLIIQPHATENKFVSVPTKHLIVIENPKYRTIEPVKKQKTLYDKLSKSEKMLIYQIVQAESGGEDIKGREAVANIIVNRYNMSKKKDIKSIIINRRQFSCISSRGNIIGGRPTKDTIKAVDSVLKGKRVLPKDANYYYAYKTLKNGCWASRNQKYICTIGGHKFYSIYEK